MEKCPFNNFTDCHSDCALLFIPDGIPVGDGMCSIWKTAFELTDIKADIFDIRNKTCDD